MNVQRPILLIDKERVQRNIGRMAAKAERSGVRFRPHFKTHQSATVGAWYRAFGVTQITVSSVEMARYFADHGWDDITIAFPVNWPQVGEIEELAGRIRLSLLVDSVETARMLRRTLAQRVGVWIDADADYFRTGIPWNAAASLLVVAQEITGAGQLDLRGVLTHAGQVYRATSPAEIVGIYQATAEKLNRARGVLAEAGFGPLEVSVGDSPACCLVDAFGAVDEIRPGQFVFGDALLYLLGACQAEDIAIAVACPVVAKYPARGEVIVYGGAMHLSKDSVRDPQGRQIFGLVARFGAHGWLPPVDDCYVASVSQEVGIVKVTPAVMESLQLGDALAVLPMHSCLTNDIQRRAFTLAGEEIGMADYRQYWTPPRLGGEPTPIAA